MSRRRKRPGNLEPRNHDESGTTGSAPALFDVGKTGSDTSSYQAVKPEAAEEKSIDAKVSTSGRDVSIFDKAEEAVGSEREADTVRSPAAAGDTLRMPSVRTHTAETSRTAALAAVPRRRGGRVADLPRRQYTPRHRFGFFSFIFGFVGLTFKMVFVTILVMALAAWFSYEAVRLYVKTPEVTVPNVHGMRVDDAVRMLSGKRLSLLLERTESSPLVAPGEIIDQRPLPGSTAKEQTSVRVVVSSGRSNYMVPDVVGETRENAMNKIRGARLEVGDVLATEDERVQKDVVIQQDPEANSGHDQPVKVNLLVSAGPRGSTLTMPDVTGKPLADAVQTLRGLGITNISTEPPGSTAGTVMQQSPLVGKLILQSQQVILRINAPTLR